MIKKPDLIFCWKKKNKKVFLEVKNVTLSLIKGIAEFPDAITSRGKKHLLKLCEASKKGYQCYMLYLIQRENCNFFKIADKIDILSASLLSAQTKDWMTKKKSR